MIFEDAHWIDPTSLELLGRTVDRIAGLGALLIVTFRPEFEAPWIERPRVTTLMINRLAQREIDVLIDRIAGNNLLPANIRQDIVERTGGILLFVEEITKAVLEAEGEGEARRTAAAIPSPRCRFLRAYTLRCWRGSTGSDQPRSWRRSAGRSGGSFRMVCLPPWRANRRRSWDRRSTVTRLRVLAPSGVEN